MSASPFDRPMAAAPYTSYRYRGRYGFIMIGAHDHAGALREAARSTHATVIADDLEVWNGSRYVPVSGGAA